MPSENLRHATDIETNYKRFRSLVRETLARKAPARPWAHMAATTQSAGRESFRDCRPSAASQTFPSVDLLTAVELARGALVFLRDLGPNRCLIVNGGSSSAFCTHQIPPFRAHLATGGHRSGCGCLHSRRHNADDQIAFGHDRMSQERYDKILHVTEFPTTTYQGRLVDFGFFPEVKLLIPIEAVRQE